MKIAIMQPYLFPYIGYFQLVKVVDKFIFYDDVQFIKGGLINRNYILERGRKKHLITLNLNNSSSNKKINEINVINNSKKILKTIKYNYTKAPYFKQTFPIIENVLEYASLKTVISEIASLSVRSIAEYLNIKTVFMKSSDVFSGTLSLGRVKRLIEICKMENAEMYANPIGGKELYKKESFNKEGINLFFLRTKDIKYRQFNKQFIPNLSIIDVIMFNSPEKVTALLEEFTLE